MNPNTQQTTGEHLLLIRGTHWNSSLSPAELQRIMTDFYGWVDGLQSKGILRGAQPLMEEGRLVTGPQSLVTDGVFAESKEAIAGYFLLAVAPRSFALLALMLLNAARLPARTDDAGNLLRLHEQNRAAWDQAKIQRGIQCLGLAAQGGAISEYHLEAGIAACHSTATDEASTNWPRILTFYDQLCTLTLSPVAAMNRAVAVSRVHGPQAGIDALAAITHRSKLESYHLYHVIQGTFVAELGNQPAALTHFYQAEKLASLAAERDFIARRIKECEVTHSKLGLSPASERTDFLDNHPTRRSGY